jgi:TPR repeat protein
MKRLLAMISILMSSTPALAGVNEGVEALIRGEYVKAFKEFEPEAKAGNPVAQMSLADLYLRGKGVPQNLEKAFIWNLAAAEQELAEAQFYVAIAYQYGEGVQQNLNAAVNWYEKAAGQRHAAAQTNLGSLYWNGQGTTKNVQAAIKWYTLSATNGNAVAQVNLGNAYKIGIGVPQDFSLAVKWYEKAAEAQHPSGIYNLGVMHENGAGVAKNLAKAEKLYLESAARGDGSAYYKLGMLRSQDLSNPVLAYALFNVAASKAIPLQQEAIYRRDYLAQKLTENELQRAQHLSNELTQPDKFLELIQSSINQKNTAK